MSKSSNIFSVSVAEANAEGGDVDGHLMPDRWCGRHLHRYGYG